MLRGCTGVVLLVSLLLGAAAAQGQEAPPGSNEAEQWAWEQIRAGRIADFHSRCGRLTPLDDKDERWRQPCREVRSNFIETLLTKEPWKGALPRQGVHIIGARLPGGLDLAGTEVETELWVVESRIEGETRLWRASFKRLVSFDGSTFEGGIDGNGLEVEGSLFIRDKATVTGDLVLRGAKIGGTLEMDSSTFAGGIDGDKLQVEGSLYIRNKATVTGDLVLLSAKIGGNLEMDSSTFAGSINGNSLEVEGRLFIRDKATVTGDLILVRAKIGGNLEMNSSTFAGSIDGNSLEVEGHLFIRDKATVTGNLVLLGAKIGANLEMGSSTFAGGIDGDSLEVEGHLFISNKATVTGDLVLRSAKIGGQLDMSGSTFEGGFSADALQVEGSLVIGGGAMVKGDLVLRGARIGDRLIMAGSIFERRVDGDSLYIERDLFFTDSEFSEAPSLIFVEVGFLDIGNAKLPGLDLAAAIIRSEFLLGSAAHRPPRWVDGAKLVLRNTSVGAFQDGPDAWPASLDLQGFTYTRLGGFRGEGQDMLPREAGWYVKWLAKDATVARQPYQQLANTFRTAGDPEKASDILYAMRERERRQAWAACSTEQRADCARAAGLWLLKVTIGYGLGLRFFRVLIVVAGVTLLGALILWLPHRWPTWPVRLNQPTAGSGEPARNLVWCVGASLDHLLPIVELNKEFSEYFHDPARARLNGPQLFYFALHALVGYLLGAFIVAGLAGLTQAA